ncbi:MAG: restriction endonuclease subunit S [Zoogloea sp.]|nr:restriction endonuclease subunit S [Zoogloea sp.]
MSLPRYPEYKDSGVAWLGEVPAHWYVCPLKYLVAFSSGGTPSKDRPDYWEGNIPWASAKDLKTDKLHDTTDHITQVAVDSGAAALLPAGTVLVVVRGMILARTFPVTQITVPMAINQDLKGLQPGAALDAPYLAWLLRGSVDESLQRLDEAGHGTKALRMDAWSSMQLPVPPKGEQTGIANFLDRETGKIDVLIAEQEKLLRLLAEKRQATITHAVTKGLNPDAPMKDSGVKWLGEVPTHWDVRPLKHLVAFFSGGTPSKENLDYWNGDVPWASAKDLKVETLQDTEDHITQHAVSSGAASTLPAGSVLVVVRGMILARTFPVTRIAVPMAINQDLKGLQAIGLLDTGFLAWLLRGSANESLRRLDEAGHGTKALRMDAWSSMLLPDPPIGEQTDIAAFLTAETARLDALTAEVSRAIDLLKERRTALISAAVTGKIDVRREAAQPIVPPCL